MLELPWNRNIDFVAVRPVNERYVFAPENAPWKTEHIIPSVTNRACKYCHSELAEES
ncbi:MAG: hypothetical protein K2L51_07580 [Clostridiales bacterium]|nr:hypothetical protein [Clostridiales bacterium]